MIITRSPLRISLGGGGTDLPSYYREHGGFLVTAAIDKYVYITLHRTFQPGFIIKYSALEKAGTVDAVQHPIIRKALRWLLPHVLSEQQTNLRHAMREKGLQKIRFRFDFEDTKILTQN